MDKSFNDQELSDIMKEIEALEEEFNGDSTAKVETSEVVAELAGMDESKAIPKAEKKPAEVEAFQKPNKPQASNAGASTSMSFKVQGNLTLDLQFEIGGKIVALEVTETGLNIQMDGGVTFSVPVTGAQPHKKAV